MDDVAPLLRGAGEDLARAVLELGAAARLLASAAWASAASASMTTASSAQHDARTLALASFVAGAFCILLLQWLWRRVIFPLFLLPLNLALFHPPATYAQLVFQHRAHASFSAAILSVARRLPFAKARVAAAQKDLRDQMRKNIRSSQPPMLTLPEKPTPHAQVLAMLRAREARGPRMPSNGHAPFSGALYVRDSAHAKMVHDAAAVASLYSNPLHGPGMFPAVRQMEAEVVAMTAALVGGGGAGCAGATGAWGTAAAGKAARAAPTPPRRDIVGLMTSGGTESIITAIKASRDYVVSQRGPAAFSSGPPEIVASPTAHAAVIKAAEWLGMKIAWANPRGADGRLRVAEARKVMTSRTVLVYASAPSYPWGVVDDVRGLAELARRWGCCCHVDACLGGFVLPFLDDDDDDDGDDAEGGEERAAKQHKQHLPPASAFARPGAWDFSASPGVTSISLDTHKYALAPKGSSVLLFSSPELRRRCFTSVTDWSGGVYISPSLAGSRSGALIAAAWASMVALGKEGLRESTRRAASAARDFARRLQAGEVPGLVVLPSCSSSSPYVPDTTVVAFTTAALPLDATAAAGSKTQKQAALPPPDIYRVSDEMERRGGWKLSALQRPPALHFCFTDASSAVVDELVADLRGAVAAVAAAQQEEARGGSKVKGGSAPLYGALAVVPDRSIVGEALEVVQDVLLEPW
jgi:sphinganine-1-phosphate aldolase